MSAEIIVNGVKYNSIVDACSEYGVDAYLFRNRIANGWSIEEALEIVERRKSKKGSIEIEDIKGYSSLAELCRDFNISYSLVRQRLQRGLSLDDAISGKSISKNIVVNGVSYKSLNDACESLNIPYYTVCMRISNGWGIEEALNPNGRKSVFVFGKEYPSLKRACDSLGVNYYKVRYMVKVRKVSLEDAFKSLGLVESIKDFCW